MRRIFWVLLLSAAAFAGAADAAEWEWTQDKGWAQGVGSPRATADEQLNYAWELEQDRRYQNAAQQYFLLLKTWPDNEEAGVALQRLANCLFKLENYYDSFKALDQVIKSYPNSIKKNDLLKIEFLIGRKFQSGAKKDLLNMNEPESVGLNAAIEVFKAVIAADAVGPYSGAAALAVADCYRKNDNPREAVVWYDRVLEQYSFSNELVAKAELGKDLARVASGVESVEEADAKRAQLENLMNDQSHLAEGAGNEDYAPVSDLKTEFNELYDKAAEKLWNNAVYYEKRGTYESLQACKFTLELITVRYPNTRFASAARKKLNELKVPEAEPKSIGNFNVPFKKKAPPPTFVTALAGPEHIQTDRVPVPGVDAEAAPSDPAAANVEPWLPRAAAVGNAAPTAPAPDRGQIARRQSQTLVADNAATDSGGLQIIDAAADRLASRGEVPLAPQSDEVAAAVPAGLRERMSNTAATRAREEERARQVGAKNEAVAAQNGWVFAEDF
ncbi:hypothetical protein AGMMS49959_12120 [Planctomycetales bacterium]|nr:hypothetical protein AGMMS49959_12120 [Planctomycetales bacterium]